MQPSRPAAVLSVVEPMMTGIGGDMFALVWTAKDDKLIGLNASGRAGALMTREPSWSSAGARDMPTKGIETVDGAGRARGMGRAAQEVRHDHARGGLQPAIDYAEERTSSSRRSSPATGRRNGVLAQDEGARATLLLNGSAPKAGEWFRNPDYAATLRADREGRTRRCSTAARSAQKLVARIQKLGGFLTIDDLQARTSRVGDADLGDLSRAIACGSCRRTTRASPCSRCCAFSTRTI